MTICNLAASAITDKEINMGTDTFVRDAKNLIVAYVNKHLDETDNAKITEEDVYVVWLVKVLQNNKALLSTTLFDGMYYEVTYNGDKDEIYIDAYKKWENICVKNLNAGMIADEIKD